MKLYTEKEFVSYNEALELRELGFNEPCLAWYCKDPYGSCDLSFIKPYYENLLFCAPTFSQAFRWFREKYKVNSHVGFKDDKDKEFAFYYYQINWIKGFGFESYEEAELACLRKLIEVTNKQQ